MTAPSLAAQIQGQASVSADNLNTYVQWCTTFAQLRSFIGLPYMTVFAQGGTAPGDGFQGNFYWLSTVTQPDDNANYIIPIGGGGGGWVRVGLPPGITGKLSLVADVNAKAVLTSIISALTTLGLVTNETT